MAKFQESEWMQGVRELRASNLPSLSLVLHDLEQLLLLDKAPTQSSGSSIASKKKGHVASDTLEPYSRVRYNRYAADTKKAFNELYAFSFALAKPPTARNIDMDTAAAFWSVLVAPKYPIMKDILEFINEKGTYKGVLEFARSVKPDLSNFEADGAWPSMLDDFVSWKKRLNGLNSIISR
ncbi:Cullin binding-domain-containing protein [Daedaleopsis nitida]|nr:Cullin binding-domain-containing protein [Daedaleopsis nitida]